MEARTEGKSSLPGRFSVSKQRGLGRHPATARRKWPKEDNKMTILCYLQAKEGPNIGYRKRRHQYWKGYRLFQLEEQHLTCQVSCISKTGNCLRLR